MGDLKNHTPETNGNQESFRKELSRMMDLKFALRVAERYEQFSDEYKFCPDHFFNQHGSLQQDIIQAQSRIFGIPQETLLIRYFRGEYGQMIEEIQNAVPTLKNEYTDIYKKPEIQAWKNATQKVYSRILKFTNEEQNAFFDLPFRDPEDVYFNEKIMEDSGIVYFRYFYSSFISWNYQESDKIFIIHADHPYGSRSFMPGMYQIKKDTIYIRTSSLRIMADFLEQIRHYPGIVQNLQMIRATANYAETRKQRSKDDFINYLTEIILLHELGHRRVSYYINEHGYFSEMKDRDDETRKSLSKHIEWYDLSVGELMPDIFMLEAIEKTPDPVRSFMLKTAYIYHLITGWQNDRFCTQHSILFRYYEGEISLDDLNFIISKSMRHYRKDNDYTSRLSRKLWNEK